MDDDAGRVDDAAQARRRFFIEQPPRVVFDRFKVEGRVWVFKYPGALGGEQFGQQQLHRLASKFFFVSVYPRQSQQLVHGGDVSHYLLNVRVQGKSSLSFILVLTT
ncbi:hypothetical protein SDC9_124205 [bioreactor metagenome]|uniref:Uncharacterized protein n=1 Tax=bioreactor metagenome TaxID=1076179 RepID=A0A645CJT8_9ZZZZ